MSHSPVEHPLRALAEAGIPPHTVRCQPGLVIGEIAGRDSVAALVSLARQRSDVRAILPTIVATGTEYGDADEPDRAIHTLRERVAGTVRVYDPVRLASPTLWTALNGRWAAELTRRYGTAAWSPCAACHLYVHLARVPLAWALGVTTVATGERDAHRGRMKFSQAPRTIDASVAALAYAGLELVEPIRGVDDDAIIDDLVGRRWDPGTGQLSCLLSGNFIGLDGCIAYDEVAHQRYLDEFFTPVARRIVDEWRAAEMGLADTVAVPDYLAITREVLEAVAP